MPSPHSHIPDYQRSLEFNTPALADSLLTPHQRAIDTASTRIHALQIVPHICDVGDLEDTSVLYDQAITASDAMIPNQIIVYYDSHRPVTGLMYRTPKALPAILDLDPTLSGNELVESRACKVRAHVRQHHPLLSCPPPAYQAKAPTADLFNKTARRTPL
jgi:hypothetical protein